MSGTVVHDGEAMTPAAQALQSSKRLVIKVGTSLIVDKDGSTSREWLAALAKDIFAFKSDGKEILIVSSGAIAVGLGVMSTSAGKTRRDAKQSLKLETKQAASAVGQAVLIDAWSQSLAPFDVPVGQVLLTLDDTRNRRRYLNARATLNALLSEGAVPVINENDTLATNEIRYGDNDRLAAHVAELAGADTLLILSDVNGLYTADPTVSSDAVLIPEVAEIDPEIEAMAADTRKDPGSGSGGMATKLASARIAKSAGCATIIAKGSIDADGQSALTRVLAGSPATLFHAGSTVRSARKTWIKNLQSIAGSVVIDDGAVAAIRSGASLLPVGIVALEGNFSKGDLILIQSASATGGANPIIARGLSTYDSVDLGKVVGRSSNEIAGILGYRRRDAVIDRDDMVLEDVNLS
ncbi:MAG: glutamate 5-kinase [Pseudomonadota bacterium]